MGDGGVACVPLQHVMERFPIPDTFCGGNGGFSSKSFQFAESQLQRKHEKKMEVEKEESGSVKGRKKGSEEALASGREKKGEVEKDDIVSDKLPKEEIEEGELCPWKGSKAELENGEFIPDKLPKREVEKGEFVPDRWRKGEVEKGEFVPEKWRKGEVEKGELGTGKVRREVDKGESNSMKWRRGEAERSDYSSGKPRRGELEKGEFIPEKWRKGEVVKDEFSSGRGRKWEVEKDDTAKEKGWKCQQERTPPPTKFSDEDASLRKDFTRSGSERRRRSSRWDHERDSRISSRTIDEELSSYKHENTNGKSYGREYSSGSWLKRHGTDSETGTRKYHGEYGDYSGSKSRRISEDSNRSGHPEKQHSRSSVESSHRNSSSSLRVSSSSRYSSRHHDSFLSSRGVHDRHYRSRSPGYSERSPHDRARHHDHRDRSPVHSDRSPHDRARYHDHRNRSPAHSERSPHDRVRHHDRRDRTPGYLERSPLDRGRAHDHRETSRKSEGHHSRYGSQAQQEKLGQVDSVGKDSHRHSSSKQPQDSSSHGGGGSVEKNVNDQTHKEEQLQNPNTDANEQPPQVDGGPEELLSMEEDMDICDTPPHVPLMADSNPGKWFYLDHLGIEQGPSKLSDLKRLVAEGVLLSDHLIKHSESDRWMTVENAASPLVPMNFSSIVSDSITKLVSPPEAPGNVLEDGGDAGQSFYQYGQERPASSIVASEPLEDLHIDERVGALLRGYTVIPGRELETIGEILQTTFEHTDWEKWGSHEGFTRFRPGTGETFGYRRDEEFGRSFDAISKEVAETRLAAPHDKDYAFGSGDPIDWFSVRWSCKGGDWKRNDEASQDRSSKKKLVLNDGFPLCQMPKSGYEDPRWHRKDELYFPSRSRRLDLPTWAFTCPDERNDCNGVSRSVQAKPLVARGAKGIMLKVIRINACVVKDHGSFISETRIRVRGSDRHSSRSIRSLSGSSDGKNSSLDGASRSKRIEHDLPGLQKCIIPINTPKDRVCTVDELQLHLGDWYYLDGAGYEHGPSSFLELQALLDKGAIMNYTSIFRKVDNVWVPVTSNSQVSNVALHSQEGKVGTNDESSGANPFQSEIASQDVSNISISSFHSLHPQFIGYTRGKLHELVMKSYKSREFAAAINEVLDPWITAKQPKKELDKHPLTSVTMKGYASLRRSDDDGKDSIRVSKRARLLIDEIEEECEMEEDLLTSQKDDYSFEELCGDATFDEENTASPETGESWGLLSRKVLARVFHFLRADMKALAFSAATCKCWNTVVKFYKGISKKVDLSSIGPNCTDSMFQNIMNGYNKEKIVSIVLLGCTNISAEKLEEVLHLFPCISKIDIRGCSQFRDLTEKFQNVKWIKNRTHDTKIFEESHSKMRSLRQITEKSSSVSKPFKATSSQLNDFSEPGDPFDHGSSLDRRDLMNQSFRQSSYRRAKLLDARKSSALLSRDAHMRHLLRKKCENGYKRMEEFLAVSLKDIMKENTFDFFVPKVAEIEDRMKNGYYIGHGLSSVKEDISRMCRDAIKAKTRGDAGDMNHIIMLFIQLVTSLENNSKSSHERDEIMRTLKDGSSSGFFSSASKYKKKQSKMVSERKHMNRSNGSSYVNGGTDNGDFATDHEIRRRLSKLNRRALDSESDTSDEPDNSSDEAKNGGESTASDTESDLDFRSEGVPGDLRGEGYFTAEENFDSMSEDREWGARMTKESLVPPVTRKYEVIDQYVIVADKEEVKRKMCVSLPDDYAEKLNAQNGMDESDMEIPEVKEYRPRKQLGDEVLEQEVYGIDPYTHNLLLDSMPEELDWSLQEKHLFIEDVLLRTLNKQVRSFTGSGNAPMLYPLKTVLEEIKTNAEQGGDACILKMCLGILKAIDSRPEDNYVAYRKGLGVVCNKEGGFAEDDFVVEFLGEVYPAWKWFEKQDGIRSLQKNNKDPAPEFYNIYLERPKGDRDGYDLVVVDAMHKANYASRICHSCRPNCEAKVTAVDGQYQIGIYTLRPIAYGEEITFDYNSVTESKEEYEASVCLCGSQVCRGSYLNLTGEGAFQKVLKECHGMLDRHKLMLEACELTSVSEEDYIDLGRAGLGTCLLAGLPGWLIAYSARLVRFINFERTKLPEEILRHNLEEKRKFFQDISEEVEKNEAEIQAEGVYNQRLQNLALTLDKVCNEKCIW
ncbi:PREDICTED: histone-lysine N-methyltransferase ATXR3-like isoform X2 [Nelumbo nucifera]|uniref:Histone-lysine N-methyltransferase ATXR3-like isoform X2 n=1 Tax=Nelumbo nucifera TaxID=4432 RepID=A0A1U8AKJ8_NELNU|nr:PREDICTED: histone-lysine N-methyltransferase ATXR3-like isoform X2 [Nelumbo nucifera]